MHIIFQKSFSVALLITCVAGPVFAQTSAPPTIAPPPGIPALPGLPALSETTAPTATIPAVTVGDATETKKDVAAPTQKEVDFDNLFAPKTIQEEPAPVTPPMPLQPLIEKPVVNKKVEAPKPKAAPKIVYEKAPLPEEIYKKGYAPDNKHLPQALYNSEYVQLALVAAAKDDISALEALTITGVDIDSENNAGESLLIYAVRAQASKSVIWLLDKKANMNHITKQGLSALHFAAFSGNGAIAKLLIDAKADVNIADARGVTPLMLATQRGDAAMVKLLLASKANTKSRMSDGRSAYDLAAAVQNLTLMSLLQ